jgi:ligand-binding sensor domain-containing protein
MYLIIKKLLSLMKKLIPFITLLLILSINCNAQNKNGSFNGAIKAKNFRSAFCDEKNIKWFLTEEGIVSFDGKKWKLHNQNKNIPSADLQTLSYGVSSKGPELLAAYTNSLKVLSHPVDPKSAVTEIDTAVIPGKKIVSVLEGKGDTRWIATDKGIYALKNDKWLNPNYQEIYPDILFEAFPVTSMATSRNGDSLYIATEGAGIARVYRDDVDGISGASVYAQWGPIILPSDNVYSVMIAPDGAKWFGTDMGVARHTGDNTLENWEVYTTAEGLVNDFVKSIASDSKGNVWLGTKGGISVFDGSTWKSFTADNGLVSNNIQCILVDSQDVVWIGTDNGVMSFNGKEFTSFK